MQLQFLILVVCMMVAAQQPSPSPQNPCAVEVAAAQLQTQAKALRVAEAEAEIGKLRGELNNAGTQVSELRATNQSTKAELAGVIAERDKLKTKIKKANGTFMCEIFHVGCITER